MKKLCMLLLCVSVVGCDEPVEELEVDGVERSADVDLLVVSEDACDDPKELSGELEAVGAVPSSQGVSVEEDLCDPDEENTIVIGCSLQEINHWWTCKVCTKVGGSICFTYGCTDCSEHCEMITSHEPLCSRDD